MMVNSTLVEKTPDGVNLTAEALLDVLTPLILDLSRELSDRERYRRLLSSLRALFPGDAAALLRLEGDTLVPLAIDGLSSDTLGRRFRVGDHPRFEQLLSRPEPIPSRRNGAAGIDLRSAVAASRRTGLGHRATVAT